MNTNPSTVKTVSTVKSSSQKQNIITNGGEQSLKVKEFRNKIGFFFLFLGLLVLFYYIYELVNRIFFNFKRIGVDFQQDILYKLHLSKNDYGLKRSDYIDFNYNIRTEEGSADCKINGRVDKDGVKYVDVNGSSDICQNMGY